MPDRSLRHLLFTSIALGLFASSAGATVVYQDTFDDGQVAPTIQALGGASLKEQNGQLTVSISRAGQGASFAIPSGQIRCFEMSLAAIRPQSLMKLGDRLTWRWLVIDRASGTQYVILESEWTKTGSTTFTTRKKDKSGNVVIVRQEVDPGDLDVVPPAGQEARVKWDRRTVDGKEQVQLEIVFIDPATGKVTKYLKLFPWQDPPISTSVAIEMTANFPVDVVLETLSGDTVHTAVAVPVDALPVNEVRQIEE